MTCANRSAQAHAADTANTVDAVHTANAGHAGLASHTADRGQTPGDPDSEHGQSAQRHADTADRRSAPDDGDAAARGRAPSHDGAVAGCDTSGDDRAASRGRAPCNDDAVTGRDASGDHRAVNRGCGAGDQSVFCARPFGRTMRTSNSPSGSIHACKSHMPDRFARGHLYSVAQHGGSQRSLHRFHRCRGSGPLPCGGRFGLRDQRQQFVEPRIQPGHEFGRMFDQSRVGDESDVQSIAVADHGDVEAGAEHERTQRVNGGHLCPCQVQRDRWPLEVRNDEVVQGGA